MAKYSIREEGKNGTVEIFPDRIVRTIKKHIGRDDVQTLAIRALTSVSQDRKRLGTDVVRIQVGTETYAWKVSNAEGMVAELNGFMFGSGG